MTLDLVLAIAHHLLVFAIFGWNFNAQLLRRGILISLGAWLIILAFTWKKNPDSIDLQSTN